MQLDAFSAQLEELRHLELELGHLPQKWNVHWDKLELPPPEQLTVRLTAILSAGRISFHSIDTYPIKNTDQIVYPGLATFDFFFIYSYFMYLFMSKKHHLPVHST